MQNVIYIVRANEGLEEYSDKLTSLISKQGIEARPCTFEDYKNLDSLADILYDDAKVIFIGIDPFRQPDVPSITSWKYERFECRIGWKRNKCVIFARATDLPFADYKDFRDYCRNMQFHYPDIIIPPENLMVEACDVIKGFFSDRENQSVYRAQYSILIYEFMDKWFNEFINAEDADSLTSLKNIFTTIKESASGNMTKRQAFLCHWIIHPTALGCAAVAFFPIPVADVIPITSAQINMVLRLGEVFNNKLTKSDAQILLKTVAAPLAGRALAKAGLIFVPGVGWTLNSAIAGIITEILGWTIANDFANKSKKGKAGRAFAK